MKKTITSVLVAGTLVILAACGSKSAPSYVSENFLGEVGEAIYSMYDLKEQFETVRSEAWNALKKDENAKVDKSEIQEISSQFEQSIRHFLETKDNAIGMTVPTELTGEEGVFSMVEPLTAVSIDIKYENEPLYNSDVQVKLRLKAVLKPVSDAEGEVLSVCMYDANDSLVYNIRSFFTYSKEGDENVDLICDIEDFYGTKNYEDTKRFFNSYILKTKKIVIQVASKAVIDGVHGELGLFDLQGPVKSCVIKNDWGNTVRTFDENGFWLTHNGQPLASVYPQGIKRDSEGRIISGKADADGNGEEYTYNEIGKVIKYHSHYYDDISTETTTYDPKGNIVKRHFEFGGMDMIEPYDETYENTDVDGHGNWTSRKVISSDGTTTKQTRDITYY